VDLFGARDEAAEAADSSLPLAERLRPKSLDEIVGADRILGPGKALRVLIESDRVPSMILYGRPGTGKTTIARAIAHVTSRRFYTLNAVMSGVADIRRVVEQAQLDLNIKRQRSILFIDEIHRFNRSQQDALLPFVERGVLTLIGATTENPMFCLSRPLRPRSLRCGAFSPRSSAHSRCLKASRRPCPPAGQAGTADSRSGPDSRGDTCTLCPC
jgi:putative ATPase